MTHEEKIQWMALWASKNGVTLDLNGEVGFGRECVGITKDGSFPDYQWHDEETYEPLNGEVWVPQDAYHKHDCVAVLGRGQAAEEQLYDWLKWFDDNGYSVKTEANDNIGSLHPIELLLGRAFTHRLVKSA